MGYTGIGRNQQQIRITAGRFFDTALQNPFHTKLLELAFDLRFC